MSNQAKPTGVPKNQIPHKPIPQSGTPAASVNASDFMTVADLLKASGMSSSEIANSPVLSSFAAFNLCRLPKTRDQSIMVVRRSSFAAHFPQFNQRMEPHITQKQTTQAPLALCAPSKSLPVPIPTGQAKSNIKPAKGLFKKTIQPGATAKTTPPPALKKSSDNVVPTKNKTETSKTPSAPSVSPELALALSEGAPSSFNPYVEGPYSTSNTAKTLRFLAVAESTKARIVDRLCEEYLTEVKRQVALNGLPGKEKLVVPDYVYEGILNMVYRSNFTAPKKQLGALKIKARPTAVAAAAAAAAAPVGKQSKSPRTPLTPVTPLISIQPLMRSTTLESQGSAQSSLTEGTESASASADEKTAEAAGSPASTVAVAIKYQKASRPSTFEQISHGREEKYVAVVVDNKIAKNKICQDDADHVLFCCGASNLGVGFSAVKNTAKYAYLVIRRLLRKKRAGKSKK